MAAGTAGAADLSGRVVDANGAPVRDAVVFVEPLPAGVSAPADARAAVMDQIGKTFVPHILPIAVGTEELRTTMLVSGVTASRLGPEFELGRHALLPVKGKDKPDAVVEVLGWRAA